MFKKYIVWFFFSLSLISCGRDNFEIPGEINEEEPDPIEIDGVYLEGTIKNEFGQKLPDVIVQLYNEAGDVSETYTDQNGYFNFDSLYSLTESFRLVCVKEDHHLGLVNMDISQLVGDSNVDVILFTDLTGLGQFEIENPFQNNLQLVLGHIDNYKADYGTIIFQAISQYSEYLSFGFSNPEGNFQLWVPPGEDFLLIATDVCQNQIFIDQYQGIDESIRELIIETQDPEDSNVTTVFGRITDCQTGEPLEDGIMLVAFEQSFHQEIYIQNGYFEFEVFECLLGSTIEIFPQFDFGPTFPILLSTEDHFGSEEWDLGEISFCEETTGSGELLINGVDSVHLGEVVAIHFEDRFIILSEQFIAELEIEDSEIIGFHSIQQLIIDYDQFSSLNKDGIDIQIEVEEYTGEPGTPLVINFSGQFIDDFSFQNISISGNINTQVF